jgi:pimeloyl-ACP methyl ester carboxylesterase
MAGMVLKALPQAVRSALGVGFVAVCGALVAGGCASSNSAAPGVSATSDPNRVEVKHLITALSIDAPDAGRRMSPEMRAGLPKLRAAWQGVVAQDGNLESYGIVASDHEGGKLRYTVELDFQKRTSKVIVVVEPANGDIIGFFFTEFGPAHPATAPGPEPSDPDVEELALSVGTAPLLGASLALPRKRSEASLPAVLMVAGSGPVDRDETLRGAKPFRDIAYGLARRGIVTLRFDKRAFMYRQQPKTVDDELIADAVAAAGTLRARSEVDAKRFVVLGHSLGALLAPEIAARSGNVRGLVLLAAPGRGRPELILEQMREHGASAEQLAPLERQVKALPTLPPDELVFGMPARYWQDMAQRDEIGTAKKLGVPIVFLRGELDAQVFASDQETWVRAFAENPAFEAVTLPRLGHALVPAGQALTSDAHVPDDVIARIADFVVHATEAR